MILRKYQKGKTLNIPLPGKSIVSDNTRAVAPGIEMHKNKDRQFETKKSELINKAYQQLQAGAITENQYEQVLGNNKMATNRLSSDKLINTSEKVVKKGDVKYKKQEALAAEKFKKQLWNEYKNASLADKLVDRTKAIVTEPLLMASNLITGNQAYIPGMADALNDPNSPNYDKYLKYTNQPKGGITTNNLFKLVNPGAWGYHAGTEVNKGNYMAGYGEMLENSAGLILGGPALTGLNGVKAINTAKKLPQQFFYNAIDPVGYGVKQKIIQAPVNLTRNLIYPELRPERIAGLLNKPGQPRIGMNRLDAFRTGLGLEQKYGTFIKDGSKYSIRDFNMTPDEKQYYISEIEAFDASKNLSGEELKEKLKEVSRINALNTSHNRHFIEKTGQPLVNEPVSNYNPWEQKRAVEISKDPNYDFSIYSADNHGIMGGYRMDVKRNLDGTYEFKAADVWDLHPTAKSSTINKSQLELEKRNLLKRKLENVEFLKLMGGKPFEIENKFSHKVFNYKEPMSTFNTKDPIEKYKEIFERMTIPKNINYNSFVINKKQK